MPKVVLQLGLELASKVGHLPGDFADCQIDMESVGLCFMFMFSMGICTISSSVVYVNVIIL